MKAKTKLTGVELWISDDLTPLRMKLAYDARLAVKQKAVHKTWVHDGKVFIIDKEGARPRRIRCKTDLPA